jgi:hypothetical protein
MDATLMVITLVSLATTGAVLLYLTRLVREERERSDARVATLAEQIRSETAGTPADALEQRRQLALREIRNLGRMMDQTTSPRVGVGQPSQPSRPVPQPPVEPGPVREATDRDQQQAAAGTLFAQEADAPSSRRLWAAAAIGAAVVGLVLALVFVLNGPAKSHEAAQAATSQPLELLSLAHARSGSSVTVSGVVRNPAGAANRDGVAAVVFLFDGTGRFLSSARADLDYRALGPGDESPFVVVAPRGESVARYRVSFRAGDSLVPHVDRRGEPAGAPLP